jgi:hypothetical protein
MWRNMEIWFSPEKKSMVAISDESGQIVLGKRVKDDGAL